MKNEINCEEIDSIGCKTRIVSRTEERELKEWDNEKHVKINYDEKTFSDKVIEKREVTQCLHRAAIFCLKKTLFLIVNKSENIFKGMWIHYNDDIKISHLSTLTICYNLSLKWMYECLPVPKSLNNLAKTVDNSTLNELLLEV